MGSISDKSALRSRELGCEMEGLSVCRPGGTSSLTATLGSSFRAHPSVVLSHCYTVIQTTTLSGSPMSGVAWTSRATRLTCPGGEETRCCAGKETKVKAKGSFCRDRVSHSRFRLPWPDSLGHLQDTFTSPAGLPSSTGDMGTGGCRGCCSSPCPC